MKRKYLDRSEWQRIKAGRNIVIQTSDGYSSATFIEQVHEKLVCNMNEKQFCLADDGYAWIMRMPLDKNWAVTAMFDQQSNIIQWYFDITKQNAVDHNGQPFYDDLYLDVVVLPTGEILLLDEDELDEALAIGDITQADYALAHETAKEIMQGIAKDLPYLTTMSNNDFEFFKTQLKSDAVISDIPGREQLC